MRQLLAGLCLLSSTLLYADSLQPFGQWPLFRGDWSNRAVHEGQFPVDSSLKPWFYQTGKGIFSTAVVDDLGSIYVGSADTWFYSFAANGNLNWRYKTGEIIDSSAVLSRDQQNRYITIPSGDGYMHHLLLPQAPLESGPQKVWTFNAAEHPHPTGKGYNWFEGNIVLGPDGNFYAGNTNWNYYAVDPEGKLRWTFPAGNMNWSAAAFDADGYLYIASLDFHFRKLRLSDGKVMWDKTSFGFNSGSLALADDLVIGTSFDHSVYAFDRSSGQRRWTFATDDHVYSSVAIAGHGDDMRIYVTSTDGRLYALNRAGQAIWSFDSGDVIRSSPVVNWSADGRSVIYFGGGDGVLYAVNDDGQLRWAFDTNSKDPALVDRNDLNASPALTPQGLAVGGEHGQLWFVPFDYPLLHPDDPRSILSLGTQDNGIHSHLLTPGSRIVPTNESFPLASASVVTLRLQSWEQGQRLPGGINAWLGRTRLRLEPNTPFEWQVSADADTLFLKPKGFWQANQNYNVLIDSQWMSHGWKIGGLEIGATQFQDFQTTANFSITGDQGLLPWQLPAERADVIELRRLSVSQPSMMPSLNQIGFDSYHWLISLVEKQSPSPSGQGRLLAWVRGAAISQDGNVEPSASREFRFPMTGYYQGDSYILTAENVALDLGGIQVKLKTLEFRGQLQADSRSTAGASFYAEPAAGSDWTYTPAIAALGLLNKNLRLPMSGTFQTQEYADHSSEEKPNTLEVLSLCAEPPTLWHAGKVRALLQTSAKPERSFDFLVASWEDSSTLTFAKGPSLKRLNSQQWLLEQTIPRNARWPKFPKIWLMTELYPLQAECRE